MTDKKNNTTQNIYTTLYNITKYIEIAYTENMLNYLFILSNKKHKTKLVNALNKLFKEEIKDEIFTLTIFKSETDKDDIIILCFYE